MAKKVITNQFKNGLIMDFSPENTPEACLTNALNATLLTYNGNEMSLQNDMGNGRVETAFLPEGYAPVGTCEFGGIIYIVSYNPQDNKCQIGCFPSPERNLSSDEISDIQGLTLTNDMFQGTGGTIKSLTQKVLIREENLNPGDKFLIYIDRASQSYGDYEYNSISQIFKTGDETTPEHRRINLHIVSIDDAGKVTYLDTDVQNYDVTVNGASAKYRIPIKRIDKNDILGQDIDSYRQLVSQQYSVFSSKVPGKLAILAELETVTGFSCGHRVITKTDTSDKDNAYTQYDIYLDYSWESNYPEVYPNKILVTDTTWINEDTENIYQLTLNQQQSLNLTQFTSSIDENNIINHVQIAVPKIADESTKYVSYYDVVGSCDKDNLTKDAIVEYSIINNTSKVKQIIFKNSDTNTRYTEGVDISDVAMNNNLETNCTLFIGSFRAPYGVKHLPLKLKYKVAPAMDFGVLEHLAVENIIDFSLIGSKTIELSGYKYYVTNDYITLNIDSDLYEEENHKISEIFIEFYDQCGFVGSYRINGRDSYNGNYVIDMPFNSKQLLPYTLEDMLNGHTDFFRYHNVTENFIEQVIDHSGQTNEQENPNNDIGVIYPNMLYGVKISYAYSSLDPITQKIQSTEWEQRKRWMYTTQQFNNYYYSINDYQTLDNSINLAYGYELRDRTKKVKLPVLSEEGTKLMNTMLNPSDFEKQGVTNQIDLYTSTEYKGDIDLKLILGTEQESVYTLKVNDGNNSFTPTVELELLNSQGDDSSDYTVKRRCSVLQSLLEDEKNSDEEIQMQPIEYDFPVKNFDFSPKTSTSKTNTITSQGVCVSKFDDNYTTDVKIFVDVNPVFTSTVENIRKEAREATIMMPICYDLGQGYNYDDIGVDSEGKIFTETLIFNGSDDYERPYKQGWYSGEIDSATGKVYSITRIFAEKNVDNIDRNLYSGHENLLNYYNKLGKRQPITLFTPQCGVGIVKDGGGSMSDKFSTNLSVFDSKDGGPDKASAEKLYEVVYTWKKDKNWGIADDENSADTNRTYIPLLITQNNAYGYDCEAMMTSAGGGKSISESCHHLRSGRWKDGGEDTQHNTHPWIFYTSIRCTKLATFVQPYINVMKQLVVVNPDTKAFLSYTGDFDPEKVRNQIISSYIVARLTNDSFDPDMDYSQSVLFNGVDFNKFVERVIYYTDTKFTNGSEINIVKQSETLASQTKNVQIKFNVDSCGIDGQSVLILPIQYEMKHEHEQVYNYVNNNNLTIYQKYTNGNPYNYNLSGEIDHSKFYYWDDSELNLYCLSSGNFTVNSSGYIDINKTNVQESETNVKYYNIYPITYTNTNDEFTRIVNGTKFSSTSHSNYAIFPNSQFIIEDFAWDPANNKHYMYFVNTHTCHPVSKELSYRFDDDGYGGTNKDDSHTDGRGTYKYMIGPSFDRIPFLTK